jgi:hypothetical protein
MYLGVSSLVLMLLFNITVSEDFLLGFLAAVRFEDVELAKDVARASCCAWSSDKPAKRSVLS